MDEHLSLNVDDKNYFTTTMKMMPANIVCSVLTVDVIFFSFTVSRADVSFVLHIFSDQQLNYFQFVCAKTFKSQFSVHLYFLF